MILDDGLEAAFERHVRLGRATPRGHQGDGARALLARRRLVGGRHRRRACRRASTATDAAPPPARPARRDARARARAHLKGKIFRIGHIGWFDVFDIAAALAAVELSLTELGADIERGVAVSAGVRGVRAARRGLSARCGPSRSSASRVSCAPPPSTRRSRSSRDGTPTAEAAARAVGCRLEQIVKSLVFVCDGAYVLALVPGDRRADAAKVAGARSGAAEVRVATAQGGRRRDGLRARRASRRSRCRASTTVADRADAAPARRRSGSAPASPAHMAALAPASSSGSPARERPISWPRLESSQRRRKERRCRQPRRSG